MSALPKSAQTPSPWWSTMEFPWAETARRAPVMVATMASYLDQLGVSARPGTVGAAEQALRHFAGQVTEADPDMHLHGRRRTPPHRGPQALAGRSAGQGRESHSPPSPSGIGSGCCAPSSSDCATGTTTTHRARTLIFPGDFPQADEPLPKFLDDPTMEKFTAALASDPDPRRRLMVEILAQTGIRVGELSGLDDKAVTSSVTPCRCASRSASCTTTATCRSGPSCAS